MKKLALTLVGILTITMTSFGQWTSGGSGYWLSGPANNAAIGSSTVTSSRKLEVNTQVSSTIPTALFIQNNYTGTSTKYGIDVNVDGAGSGSKYGISSSVVGLAADASSIYGYQVVMTPSGTGSSYGVYSYNQSAGTGIRRGFYNLVYGASGNTSDIYGDQVYLSHAGAGNSYVFYGDNAGAGGGTKYGVYLNGESYNYFSGNIGIGVTNPVNKLDVEGGASIGSTYAGTTAAPTNGAIIEGNVGIGINAPTQKLHVVGNILSTGTITPSDLRLKENITKLNYGLDEVLKLRPVSYTWKNESKSRKTLGLIAQETLNVIPEVIETPKSDNEFYSMNYPQLIPVLINAIQEQQKQIDDLQSQVAQYKDLSAQVEELKKLMAGKDTGTSKTEISGSNKK